MTDPLLSLRSVGRTYRSGANDLTVFQNLNLDVAPGEQVAVTGESGAGKSTLLHLIAGLDRPSAGSISYKGRELTALNEEELAGFRNREIGYVWQHHHLLPEFTAAENVMMPLLVRGADRGQAACEAAKILEETGLVGRGHHRAGELSGGEQQRVALARALVTCPSLLLADEPTGNLDAKTGEKVFALLGDLRRSRGLAMVLVTHNPRFAAQMDRHFCLQNGQLCESFATNPREGVS